MQVQAEWRFSHAVVAALPFQTSFNTGAGRGWFQGGALVAQGAAAAAAAAAAAGFHHHPSGGVAVTPPRGQEAAIKDSSKQTTPTAAGAAGAAAGEEDEGAAQPGKGWFNMLLTDTLPNGRDPLTQQASLGLRV